MNWLYDRIRLRSLFVLIAALGALSMMVEARAATVTYTITKPTSYFDGTAFGTEQLVYIVYNAANNAQLFSTLTLTGTNSTVADGVTCLYVRAGVFNVTANTVIAATLSDPSPSSCKPAPVAKKVGTPGFAVKW
jgi:hypothetical protein